MLERTVAMMNDKGQWISIMDLGELNLTKMMGNLNIVKAFTALAKNHFPERLDVSHPGCHDVFLG